MITWTIHLPSVGHKTSNFLQWSKGLNSNASCLFSFSFPGTRNPDIHRTIPDGCRGSPRKQDSEIQERPQDKLHLIQPRCRAQCNLSSFTSINFFHANSQTCSSDSTVRAFYSEYPTSTSESLGLVLLGVKEEHSAELVDVLVPEKSITFLRVYKLNQKSTF